MSGQSRRTALFASLRHEASPDPAAKGRNADALARKLAASGHAAFAAELLRTTCAATATGAAMDAAAKIAGNKGAGIGIAGKVTTTAAAATKVVTVVKIGAAFVVVAASMIVVARQAPAPASQPEQPVIAPHPAPVESIANVSEPLPTPPPAAPRASASPSASAPLPSAWPAPSAPPPGAPARALSAGRHLQRLPETGLPEEIAMVKEMNSALERGDLSRAKALADEHRRRFGAGMLVDEAEGLRLVAACQAGELDARTRARAFEATHPTSPIVDRVRRSCENR